MNPINPMNANREALMKHFASVLRARAIGKEKAPSISEDIVRYLSRKELIEIVKKKHKGTIPKEYNLIELENIELVALIEDEVYVIAYVTQKWSENVPKKLNGKKVDTPVPPVKPKIEPKTDQPNSKPNKN